LHTRAIHLPKKSGWNTKDIRTYNTSEIKCRAAVVATNSSIDTTMIQYTDDDTVVAEIIKGSLKIILINMYFDGENLIENNIAKIEAILKQAQGTGVLIATDCNAWSTLWHDSITNKRGRIFEEFLASNQLHVANEASNNTTFRNHMGTSNIDVTITSPNLIGRVTGWEISDIESMLDHSIIKYAIGPNTRQGTTNIHSTRYITNNDRLITFQQHITQIIKTRQGIPEDTGSEELDETLSSIITEEKDIEKQIDEFSDAIKVPCNKSFPRKGVTQKATVHKSVPWWTQQLTVLRKRTNAQRRLYQRTRNNDDLRTKRKAEYSKGKATYAATIKREKIRSWQEYCNTTAANPWNAVYNLAKGRRNTPMQLSTLGSRMVHLQQTPKKPCA